MMPDMLHIEPVEELKPLLNDRGFMEIIVRDRNKRYRTFAKVAMDKVKKAEAQKGLNKAISLLKNNANVGEKLISEIDSIAKLSSLNLMMSGINLCSSYVGFAMMSKKLNGIGEQLKAIESMLKKNETIKTNYDFDIIRQSHLEMLDCIKRQSEYPLEKMHDLLKNEFAMLKRLQSMFGASITSDPEALLVCLLLLASMFSVTLKYYDEAYYFTYRDTINNSDEKWHLQHDEWLSIFDALSSREFIEKIQDYGFFEIGLNTTENTAFYIGYFDQVQTLKQEIVDNQTIIVKTDDHEGLKEFAAYNSKVVRNKLENALQEAGEDVAQYDEAIRIAVS